MPCGYMEYNACSAEILSIYLLANDPDHPDELACCKEDSPEQHFFVANDPDHPNELAVAKRMVHK